MKIPGRYLTISARTCLHYLSFLFIIFHFDHVQQLWKIMIHTQQNIVGASADHRSTWPMGNDSVTLKRDRGGKAIRSDIKMLNRRNFWLMSSATPSSPTSIAITPTLSGSMPALPFSTEDSTPLQERPNKEFQWRSTLMTADIAREMSMKLTSDTRQQHRRA